VEPADADGSAGSDDDVGGDDDDASGDPEPIEDPSLVAIRELRAATPRPGEPLFLSQEELADDFGIDHFTALVFAGETDRWLDDFTGGFAALDCDGDGDVDLLFTSGDGEHGLYLNDGTGHFARDDEAGVAFPGDLTASASTADFDRDGDADVLLLNQFANPRLLVNDGTCRFDDQAQERGLANPDALRTLHANWADLDNDGWLDLYLSNWASAVGEDQPGVPPEPHPDRLFLSDRAGAFVEFSEQLPADTQVNLGMVTAFFDREGDGDLDLYQTNDRGRHFVGNRLFRNDGRDGEGRWSFADVTEEAGFANDPDGMGLAFADVDGDGDADIFNSGDFETLFVDDGGDGVYVESAAALGLLPSENFTLSWGGSWFDPDADGDPDLVYVESFFFDWGLEQLEQYKGLAYYYENRVGEDGRLHWTNFTSAFGERQTWRAALTLDVNGDGFEDFVTSVVEGNPLIFLTNPTQGRDVVQVRLKGRSSNLDGRGARVSLLVGEREQVRWPGAVDVYSTGAPTWMTFGLGEEEAAGPLRVYWPSGILQQVSEVEAGTVLEITEPD
jgi:hypothetical protein